MKRHGVIAVIGLVLGGCAREGTPTATSRQPARHHVPGTGSILGTARGLNARPSAGVTIVIASHGRLWSTTSGSLGAFEIDDLPPGDYETNAIFGDRTVPQGSVHVVADETSHLVAYDQLPDGYIPRCSEIAGTNIPSMCFP